jgi:drug/metabolite transporter (DMT)-like permease
MILAVVFTLCAATTNGIIRTLSGEMHPFEIVFFRSLIGLLIFVPVIGRIGWGALDIGATAVLVSSAMGGIVSIIIKVLSRTDSSLTTTLFGLLVTTPVALIAAIPVWTTPSLGQLLPLIGIGTISVLSNLCRTQSLKEADITVVAPFEFLALPWVALIGYAYFSEVPDIWTWIGGAIIFVATTYIAYRERHIKSEGSTAGIGVA